MLQKRRSRSENRPESSSKKMKLFLVDSSIQVLRLTCRTGQPMDGKGTAEKFDSNFCVLIFGWIFRLVRNCIGTDLFAGSFKQMGATPSEWFANNNRDGTSWRSWNVVSFRLWRVFFVHAGKWEENFICKQTMSRLTQRSTACSMQFVDCVEKLNVS